MPINFVPNDPAAIASIPMRQTNPRPNRPAGRAGFTFSGQVPTVVHPVGSPGFLFWQCREAALAAIDVWETLNGPLTSWQGNKKNLRLRQDAGLDLNAFYDRASLSFFHATGGGTTFFSGASTDVVAHEAGHAFLDRIRPDFWDSMLFEVNSFHEAFGDCVAILTALSDKASRLAVLAKLGQANAVESTAEDLAKGIKVIAGANHNAAAARRGLNKFKHSLPSTLPDFGSAQDGPGKLINEIHSFGQIFSGCFYDTIVNIFAAGGAGAETGLLAAAKTAGKLLIQAAQQAPQGARYFRSIGRAMLLADQQQNNGKNETAIRKAFEGHGMALSLGVALSAETALAGTAPTLGTKARLSGAVKKDLMKRLGAAPGGKTFFSAIKIGTNEVGEFIHERAVPLGKLDNKLKGVVAMAPETVLVGDERGRAAVLGILPEAGKTVDEVETFVWSLLKQGAIDFGGKPKSATRKSLAVAPKPAATPVTHTIRTVRGTKTLTRMRFACGCLATER